MKQQILFQRIFTSFLFLAVSSLSWAYDFKAGGIYYVINSDGKSVSVTYKDTSYKSYSGAITIPATVTLVGTTYNVTGINENAFYNCNGLTSITIPESVTSIGKDAFDRCYYITKAEFDNIESLCKMSFASITSNPMWHYTTHLYINGEEVTNVVIPESITTIGNYTFLYCSSLKSITIPESVTSIGSYAFSGCSSLISIVIPSSVTSIGNQAFGFCRSLTSITIPNSVTSIGEWAFHNCSSLTSITIPESVTSIGDVAFYNCSSLTSIIIPESVTSIGYDVFSCCSSLTTVSIPNSVMTIGESAFYNCSSLKSIVIPSSVTSIGSGAFCNCSSLESVTSKIMKPFVFGNNAFRNISSDCLLIVPMGTKNTYIAKGWTTDVFGGGVVEYDNRESQSLSLTSLPAMTYGNDAYTLPEATEEGLTLAWTSSNEGVATVSGNKLAVIGAGTAIITATQAGNENYLPMSKEYTLTVAKASLTITADDATRNVGEANPAFTAKYEGFVNGDNASVFTTQPVLSTTATEDSPVGSYDITVTGAAAANYDIT